MELGEAIRKRISDICKERGLTINGLANQCGITQSTLNNIMSGRNNSTKVSTVKKICDGVNITLFDFFDSEIFLFLEQEIK